MTDVAATAPPVPFNSARSHGWRVESMLAFACHSAVRRCRSADYRFKVGCARLIGVAVALGAIARAGHVYHSRDLWALPLLGAEIVLLVTAAAASSVGSIGLLSHLDATQPLLSWRNIAPTAWLGTLFDWPLPQNPRESCVKAR